MQRSIRILMVGAFIAAAGAISPGTVRAQFNPYAQLYQQNLFAQQMFAAQAAQLNGFGVNPYGPGAPATGFGLNNPYAPTTPGYGVGNPYTPYDPYYGGGGGYYNPYFSPGYGAGQYLMGSADVMRSYGTVINAQEQARILREQAYQARFETRKKEFELEMYIKANTPTYTQEQERIAKLTLRRIQTNSTPSEIVNGRSLNYLLDDLRKFPTKKTSLEPLILSEGVLSQLSVTKSTYGLGLLRDDGKVTWPTAIADRIQRKALEEQMKELVKSAYKGQLDANLLKDVRAEIDKVRDDLTKRVNDVPSGQYVDAKRFLQEFAEAAIALEKGEAVMQGKFQRFVEGGKSVQDVADFMIQNGLRFGPATARDEGAYRAVHPAFASYDIAVNSAAGSDVKE